MVLQPLLFAMALVSATVAIHALGTALLIRQLKLRAPLFLPPRSVWLDLRILLFVVVALMTLHLLEIALWAEAYYASEWVEQIPTMADAFYFSAVTFTTLGYGDITLTGNWRVVSGVEAMSGILLIGWSTALLFALVQRLMGIGPAGGNTD